MILNCTGRNEFIANDVEVVDGCYLKLHEKSIMDGSEFDETYIIDYGAKTLTSVEMNTDFIYIGDKKVTDGFSLLTDKIPYTIEDFEGMTAQEACYARNEIYAKHGRIFKSIELNDYFGKKKWYNGTIEPDKFNDKEMLSELEIQNAVALKEYENSITNGEGYKLDQEGYNVDIR